MYRAEPICTKALYDPYAMGTFSHGSAAPHSPSVPLIVHPQTPMPAATIKLKPGPRPKEEPSMDKRVMQNRQAQRSHRQRKAEHVKNLETELAQSQAEIRTLKLRIAELEFSVGMTGPASAGPSASLPVSLVAAHAGVQLASCVHCVAWMKKAKQLEAECFRMRAERRQTGIGGAGGRGGVPQPHTLIDFSSLNLKSEPMQPLTSTQIPTVLAMPDSMNSGEFFEMGTNFSHTSLNAMRSGIPLLKFTNNLVNHMQQQPGFSSFPDTQNVSSSISQHEASLATALDTQMMDDLAPSSVDAASLKGMPLLKFSTLHGNAGPNSANSLFALDPLNFDYALL
ncbi:hypothetical protein BC830DRAFT_350511 [Chytriomyces sp. MP71]|nr:hypothetical protein BC830DRAFT_350511 [Chytriomyces sp. MP71]